MDTQKLDAKVGETTVSPQPHTHAIWHADILELLLQVNAVADSGSAAAPLSGIDTHSRLPWRGPPSLLLCSAYYKAV